MAFIRYIASSWELVLRGTLQVFLHADFSILNHNRKPAISFDHKRSCLSKIWNILFSTIKWEVWQTQILVCVPVKYFQRFAATTSLKTASRRHYTTIDLCKLKKSERRHVCAFLWRNLQEYNVRSLNYIIHSVFLLWVQSRRLAILYNVNEME